MGSIASGVGSAVGGVFGGLSGGMLGGSGAQSSFQAQVPQIERQKFLDAIKDSQGSINSNQAAQGNLASALQAQMEGRGGPNLATQQMKAATDQNIAQSAGMIASQKGISPALAARLSAQNAATQSQQVAQNAGITTAQQQLAAQGQLANVLGQQGGQQLQNQSILQQGQANQNSALTNAQLGAQQINAQTAATNAQTAGNTMGSLLNAAGSVAGLALLSGGGEVDGRAQASGDSYDNDTVPAMLSPKEIVLPRSVTLSEDAPEKAAEFVAEIKKMKRKKNIDFKDVLASHQKLNARLTRLEEQRL